MKIRVLTLCAASVLGAGNLLLTGCAHEPITQTNAANASGSKISSDARKVLKRLYAENSHARKLGARASGILVFPEIYKGGLIVGAEGGNGVLFRGGKSTAYYQSAGASYGLQAGVQKYGYVLFLMTSQDVRNLDQAGGWEVGSSPSLVLVDEGYASNLTTTTLQKGVYAFVFNQKGLMAGLGFKGTKITRIHPGS